MKNDAALRLSNNEKAQEFMQTFGLFLRKTGILGIQFS
jgi:hypothetical protein